MLYLIFLIFFKVVEYVELARSILTKILKDKIPKDNHLANMLFNKFDVAEKQLKAYNPFTIIISVLISYFITNLIIRIVKRIWNRISNTSFN